MKPKAVIFDLDGTLYDNSGIVKWLMLGNLFHLRMLLAERVCRGAMAGLHYEGHETVNKVLFQRMARWAGCSEQKCADWFWKRYMPLMVKVLRRHCKLNKWVIPTLERLRSAGVRMAVFSEYPCVAEKLEALGLDKSYFEILMDAARAGGFKPCRKSFIYVAKKLNEYPADILMVGDREDTDGAGAESAKMQFYLVDRKNSGDIDLPV